MRIDSFRLRSACSQFAWLLDYLEKTKILSQDLDLLLRFARVDRDLLQLRPIKEQEILSAFRPDQKVDLVLSDHSIHLDQVKASEEQASGERIASGINRPYLSEIQVILLREYLPKAIRLTIYRIKSRDQIPQLVKELQDEEDQKVQEEIERAN